MRANKVLILGKTNRFYTLNSMFKQNINLNYL